MITIARGFAATVLVVLGYACPCAAGPADPAVAAAATRDDAALSSGAVATPARSPKSSLVAQLEGALGAIALPDDKEIAAGEPVAASLLAVAPLVDDAELQRYVNRTGRWVASQSERADLPWRFGVIDSDDVNAFAVPGGYVLVTRGLYASLSEPSELAGVLAHEIAHVVARHHLKISLSTQVLSEAARRAESALGGANAALARNLLGAGAGLFARRLDQNAEFEADRMAVVLAARAGFDPWGLPAVLSRLALVPRDDDRLALLFRTHPPPNDRLRQLDRAINDTLAPYASPSAGGALQVMPL